jgi:hypothetical protein
MKPSSFFPLLISKLSGNHKKSFENLAEKSVSPQEVSNRPYARFSWVFCNKIFFNEA